MATSYKDASDTGKTYCNALCINLGCDSNQQVGLREILEIPEDQRPPITLSDLRDSEVCGGYQFLGEMFGMTEAKTKNERG